MFFTQRTAVSIHSFVAACDPDAHPSSPVLHHVEIPQETFDDAKKSLSAVLAEHKLQDAPRVVALLRPLTNHRVLRERILTEDMLETLMKLLDAIINQGGAIFGQAMDGLDCLLQCGALLSCICKIDNSYFIRGHPGNYHRQTRCRFSVLRGH